MNNRSFYVTYPSIILFDKRLNSTDLKVYAIISTLSNNKDGYCYLSYNKLAKIANLKRRQFYYIVKKLLSIDILSKVNKNNKKFLCPSSNFLELYKERINKKINNDNFYWYDWLEED